MGKRPAISGRLSSLQAVAVAAVAVLVLNACGAPTKSAGDVAHIFNAGSQSLQEKLEGICAAVKARDTAPSTKTWNIGSDCGNAGRAALDLQRITKFEFLGLDGDVPDKKTQEIIHRSVRAQIWLNRSLLGMAQALSRKMREKQTNGNNQGLISLPSSADNLQNIAQSKIEILDEPKFDVDSLAFSTRVHLQLSGIITADHILAIDGRYIDNAFAVTVTTTEDKAYEQSIMQNFQAVLFVVPHAADVYLDLTVDLNAHNVGLESLLKQQLETFLGTGLKSMVDSLFTL